MTAKKSLRKEGLLFLLAIFCELIFVGLLIWNRRMPRGHDGFQYFTLQYYFLNNAVTSGEIPQWMPFMTHGTIATWWYGLQAGLLQNVLVYTGNLLKNINFLPIFNLGIFVDELLLLVGVWLLSRRFFSSYLTAFFVTVTVIGSCLWFAQPWWNFHLYYAIPLILYFFHTFLESGKWRYFFLAGNLLAIQMLGNLPYFISITTLVIFFYFLFYSVFNFKEVQTSFKNLKWGWGFLACMFFIMLSFIAVYAIIDIGTDQIANYNFGRALDGTTPLDIFLAYGGNLDLVKWIELFLGVSPGLDYTLYIGLFSFPLIILGLVFNLKRKNLHFLCITLLVLFFSMGTSLSKFFYHYWPFMKFFRHLASVSPIVKLFLCFLAGFGFETLFTPSIRDNLGRIKRIIFPRLIVVAAILMLVLSLALFYYTINYPSSHKLLFNLTDQTYSRRSPDGDITVIKYGLPVLVKVFNKDVLQSRFNRSFLFALILSFLFGVLAFITHKNCRISIAGVVLFLQLSDIFTYRFAETNLRTVSLSEDQYKITAFQTMPYAKKRSMSSFGSFLSNNPRAAILLLIPIGPPPHQKFETLLYGQLYWVIHSFTFKDQLNSPFPFRVDHWLLPLDNFMRAYWGQSIHDLSIKPAGLVYYYGFTFPSKHPASKKITGLTEDKIQFFSKAYLVDSDDSIVSNITDSSYAGDILFLSRPQNERISPKVSKWYLDISLSANMRLKPPYRVKHFDSNNLEVAVDIQNQDKAWMLYSDVWHPFWRATVNGKPAQIFKANLAYKAVQLGPGLNTVHFYFKSNPTSFLYRIFGLNSMLWIGIIIWLAGRISFGRTGIRKDQN